MSAAAKSTEPRKHLPPASTIPQVDVAPRSSVAPQLDIGVECHALFSIELKLLSDSLTKVLRMKTEERPILLASDWRMLVSSTKVKSLLGYPWDLRYPQRPPWSHLCLMRAIIMVSPLQAVRVFAFRAGDLPPHQAGVVIRIDIHVVSEP